MMNYNVEKIEIGDEISFLGFHNAPLFTVVKETAKALAFQPDGKAYSMWLPKKAVKAKFEHGGVVTVEIAEWLTLSDYQEHCLSLLRFGERRIRGEHQEQGPALEATSGQPKRRKVKGYKTAHKCDDRCKKATGTICHCSCAGANHGTEGPGIEYL